MISSTRYVAVVLLAWCAVLVSASSKTWTIGYDKLPIDAINSTVDGKHVLVQPPSPWFGLYYQHFSLQANTAQVYGLQPYSPPSTLITNILTQYQQDDPNVKPLMSVKKGTFTLRSMWIGCEIDLFPLKIPVDCAITATVHRADNSVAKHRMQWKASNKMAFHQLPAKVFANAKSVEWTWIEGATDVTKQPQFDDITYTINT